MFAVIIFPCALTPIITTYYNHHLTSHRHFSLLTAHLPLPRFSLLSLLLLRIVLYCPLFVLFVWETCRGVFGDGRGLTGLSLHQQAFPTNVPVYSLVLAILLPTIYMLPAGLIFAVTGQTVRTRQLVIRCLSRLPLPVDAGGRFRY